MDSACAALSSMGIKKGDRILVQSRNSFAMFETMFAAFKLGAVWVPVNFRLTEDEVVYIAQHSGARVLAFDPVFRPNLTTARKVGTIEHVISLDTAEEGELAWDDLASGSQGVCRLCR